MISLLVNTNTGTQIYIYRFRRTKDAFRTWDWNDLEAIYSRVVITIVAEECKTWLLVRRRMCKEGISVSRSLRVQVTSRFSLRRRSHARVCASIKEIIFILFRIGWWWSERRTDVQEEFTGRAHLRMNLSIKLVSLTRHAREKTSDNPCLEIMSRNSARRISSISVGCLFFRNITEILLILFIRRTIRHSRRRLFL